MTALRYLILIRRKDIDIEIVSQQVERKTGLSIYPSLDGMTLLISSEKDVISLPNGFILGTLFKNDNSARQHFISQNEYICKDNKYIISNLFSSHWGSYICLYKDRISFSIARDPSGGLPCYYIERPDIIVFASDVDILCRSGLFTPDINWTAFVQHLYIPDLPSTETALQGLKQIASGTIYEQREQRSTISTIWNPWEFAHRPGTTSVSMAVERLEQTILFCCAAWSSCYPKALLSLSGGLDSSIVAAALHAAHSELSCLTMTHHDLIGDERQFARTVTNALGYELIEAEYDLNEIDVQQSAYAHLPRPGGRTQLLASRAKILEAARLEKKDAIFTGNGGDAVFHITRSVDAIVDRFRTERIGSGLLDTILDICHLTGNSIWRVIFDANRVSRRRPNYIWEKDGSYLNNNIIRDEDGDLIHPWLDAPKNALPGKATHISMLLRTQNHLEGFDRNLGFSIINPLMSQPIMELCLRIPSWEACAGGRNRAVARAAFNRRLPHSTVNRRTKGSPDGFAAAIVDHFRDAIRTRLLDGTMSNQRLLDRPALEYALRDDAGEYGITFVRLLLLLDAEAWAETWIGRGRAIEGGSLEPKTKHG